LGKAFHRFEKAITMSSNAASGFGKAVAGFGKAVTGFGKAVTGFGKAVTGERGTNPSTLERKPEWVLAPSVSSSSHHRRAELEPGRTWYKPVNFGAETGMGFSSFSFVKLPS
jgi:hypothetical protein